MKISQIRKYRSKTTLSPRLMPGNPMLLLGLDIPFVVVAANSLKNAVAISIEMFFIHTITMLVAWFIAKRLEVWQRFFVIPLTSTIVMLFVRSFVISVIPNYESAGSIYLFLLAINGMTLFQGCFLEKDAELLHTIKTTLLNVATFTGIMFFFSIIREYFGNGTLWGNPMQAAFRLSGLRNPFFGFIMLGLLLAFARFLDRQFAVLQIFNGIRQETLAARKRKGENI